jgi:N-methylhydantoinase A/oxoprolinase/acetone carboxylase beta subunit
LEGVERQVLEQMGGRVAVASTALNTLQLRRVMERLVQRGVLQIAAFTPTDASHVLGIQATYDVAAARKAAELFARNRDRMGKAIAPDAETVSNATIDTLVRRSAEAVLAAAFINDGLPAETVAQPVVQAVLNRRLEVVRLGLGLSAPLVGLGASAPAYYPRVAALLGAESRIPAHADVANAVGAVVGRVRMTRESVVSSPAQGQYVVHAGEGPQVFVDLLAARAFALEHLTAALHHDMVVAGAPVFETREQWVEQTVAVDGLEMFVEGRLTLTASGRPELAATDG